MQLTQNGLKPEIEAAFFAGTAAGRRNAPVTDCPYRASLFDPDQLAAVWLKARKEAIDRRYGRRRQRAFTMAEFNQSIRQ